MRGRVAVFGFGAIGAGVALAASRAGYETRAWLRDESKIPQERARLAASAAWLDANLGTAPTAADEIEFARTAEDAADAANVAIECIAENADAKAALFRQIAPKIRDDGFYATTTSGLSVTSLAEAGGCGDRLVGLHFWNPPELMPLVEVVQGRTTSEAVIQEAEAFVTSLDKLPVLVRRDIPGFIGNRLLHALWREAIYLVETEVATPEDIDMVARLTFGLRAPALGPLENMDIVGLDLVHTIHEYLLADLAANQEPSTALAVRVAEGDVGARSGRGFYEWTAEDRQRTIERRDRQIVKELLALKAAWPSSTHERRDFRRAVSPQAR